MMNWILLVMAGIAAAVIAVLVGGLVTPTNYTVVRRISLRSSPERVRQAFADVTQWPVWTERAINVDTGELAHSASRNDHTGHSDTLTLRVADDDTQAIGSFEFVVSAEGVGTMVECTEQGRIRDPLRRFLRTHVTGLAGNADAALRALAEQLDEFDRTPVAVA